VRKLSSGTKPRIATFIFCCKLINYLCAAAAVATLPSLARGQCVPVSGLSFCSSVNYSVNASSFANAGSSPQEQDHLVQAWYEKNAPDQLQTQDCLEAWKAYLCSFYFPKVRRVLLSFSGHFLRLAD
jgi:hypothetical protein